jgi:hypothetical protein
MLLLPENTRTAACSNDIHLTAYKKEARFRASLYLFTRNLSLTSATLVFRLYPFSASIQQKVCSDRTAQR